MVPRSSKAMFSNKIIYFSVILSNIWISQPFLIGLKTFYLAKSISKQILHRFYAKLVYISFCNLSIFNQIFNFSKIFQVKSCSERFLSEMNACWKESVLLPGISRYDILAANIHLFIYLHIYLSVCLSIYMSEMNACWKESVLLPGGTYS